MPHFEMVIDDIFEVPDRGTVVVGRAASGEIRAGDHLFVHTAAAVLPVRVKFLESFHNVGPQIRYAGENVAAGLEGVAKADVPKGSRLSGDG